MIHCEGLRWAAYTLAPPIRTAKSGPNTAQHGTFQAGHSLPYPCPPPTVYGPNLTVFILDTENTGKYALFLEAEQGGGTPTPSYRFGTVRRAFCPQSDPIP